jgi:hypothetical protein
MAITLTQLRTELQEKIGSTANIKASADAQKNALNRCLDRMQLLGNWLFTVRDTTIDYDVDVVEYEVDDDLGLTDFKDVFRLPSEDNSGFNARHLPEKESWAVHNKGGKKILSIYLPSSDSALEMEYFSTCMVQTAAGVFQLGFVDGTDVFLGDDDMKPVLLEWAYYEMIRNTKTKDKGEVERSRDEAELLMREAFRNYGMNRNKGIKRVNTKL